MSLLLLFQGGVAGQVVYTFPTVASTSLRMVSAQQRLINRTAVRTVQNENPARRVHADE